MMFDLEHLNAVKVSADTYEVRLSNGETISIVEKPKLNGVTWNWSVNGQYFYSEEHACRYLKKVIAEKLTGKRIIYHARKKIPDICGVNGAACRRPGECNSAICQYCPVAEAFFAERGGVELIYAVDKTTI